MADQNIPELSDYADYHDKRQRQGRRLADRLTTELADSPRRRPVMQSWTLSAGLASAVAIAALVVPTFLQSPPTETEAETASPLVIKVPAREAGLSVSAALDQSVLLQGAGEDRYLVVEFTAPEPAEAVRQPVHLAVVIDTSGSMAGDGKIEYARRAIWELVDQLEPMDTFTLVGFEDSARLYRAAAPVADKAGMFDTIASLSPGGGTRIGAGLQMGLDQLAAISEPGAKRVVVLSDGLTDEMTASLAEMARSEVEAGTTVSTLGLGLDFDSDLLLAISDAGGGRYHYVDEPDRLAGIFAQELQTITQLASRGVSLQVDVAEGVEVLNVFGYEDYDGGITAGGYHAFIGDMHGGERRKVVARLRVPDGALGTKAVADVTVRYSVPGDDERKQTSSQVIAAVSADAAEAAASVNASVGVLAARAVNGDILAKGRARWRAGNRDAALETFADGRALLDDLEGRYRSDEVGWMSAELDRQLDAYEQVERGSEYERRLMLETLYNSANNTY